MSGAASAGPRIRPSPDRLVGDLTSALTPVASAAGFDLEEVEIVPAGRRRVLRLVVDRDDGLDLDAVALISRAFATALDGSDVMGSAPYTLEVTSPGVDRPLTEPRHWRRAVGRLVRVRPRGGGSEVRGRIVDADDATVTVAVGPDQRVLSYDEFGPGRIDVEFNRGRSDGGVS